MTKFSMEGKIKTYTPRSLISAVCYAITFCLVLLDDFTTEFQYAPITVFLIGLAFQIHAEIRSRSDHRYRNTKLLSYNDQSIRLSWICIYNFGDLLDISNDNGYLVIRNGGLPIKYKIYDSEQGNVDDLIDRFRQFKNNAKSTGFDNGCDVSYIGKTMHVSLPQASVPLESLLDKIEHIEKQVVIDSYIVHFPDGQTAEYYQNPLKYNVEDVRVYLD